MNGFDRLEKAQLYYKDLYEEVKNSPLAEYITNIHQSDSALSFEIEVHSSMVLQLVISESEKLQYSAYSRIYQVGEDNMAYVFLYHKAPVFSYINLRAPEAVLQLLFSERYDSQNRK